MKTNKTFYLGFKTPKTDDFLIRGFEQSGDLYRIEIYNVTKCKSKFIECNKSEMLNSFNRL